MEVLFHFILELIKIAFLGSIYALLVLVTFIIIGHYKQSSWFNSVSKKKLRLWFLSGCIISIGLFIFMFTYFGDHGLGDEAKIPIGHGIVVYNTNWTEYGYIKGVKTTEKIDIETTRFNVTNDKLFGNLESGFNDFKNTFFVYNMETQEMKEFLTKAEFDFFAVNNNLSKSEELLTFEDNYKKHWRGWRFWLLP